jgi:hypothetical protein
MLSLVIWHMQATGASGFFYGIGFCCFVCAVNALGGPPLLTDDPDTPGPNHWEINIAMTSEDVAQQWELQTPILDMNYGVGDHIQLKYQVPLNVYVPQQAGTRVGVGNTLAGVKWRFIDQTNWSWLEVSTYPQLEFVYPKSSVQRVMADNGHNLLLPIEAERQFKSLIVYAEGGYVFNEFREPVVFYGLAAERELSEKFSLLGELYGGFGRDFQENGLSFNLGFRRPISEHVAIIGSAGRAISGPASERPSFMSYLGVQLTF